MKDKKQGLKSALDLALERMAQKGGGPAGLSAKQKEAIAEIDREIQAKMAETEIMMGQSLVAARARGDGEEMQKIEEQKRLEIARVRDRGEQEKDAIRSGPA